MHASRSPAITISEGELTAVIDGEFDMPATFAIEPALERALEAPGLRRFTLDLSGLTFIDSVGIGVVIRLAADLEERGVPFRIVPGPRHVHRVFTTVGMDQLLPFEPESAESTSG
jgi:anti-sigma B factor antagonist